MARKDSQRALFLLILAFAPVRVGAQVTETPIAFDSSGKVRTLTPSLAARFELKAPAWPVRGSFLEARLYSISTGGRVLAVERELGAIDRFAMSDEQTAALQAVIDDAMTRSGTLVTEERTDLISQPARGAFVRNQMVLTWGLYGPLMASLTDDAKAGTVVYLLATGASYFITTGIGKKTVVTRAQNHLSFDGALRGAGATAGLLYAFSAEDVDDKALQAVALAGAFGGTVAGYKLGRRRTDSEAEATTKISTLSALTALGVVGATGSLDDSRDARGLSAGIVAAGLAGYALGPTYPRRARYAVTRGDLQVASIGALLGAAVAATPFIDTAATSEVLFGSATAGMLAGAFVADRLVVRPFDYGSADATQAGLGMAAGALVGGGLVVLTEPSQLSLSVGMVTAGALLGTVAGHKLAGPPRAGSRPAGTPVPQGRERMRGTSVKFDSWAAALAAAGMPGRHTLVSLRF